MLCRSFLSKTGMCKGGFAQSRGMLHLSSSGQYVGACLLSHGVPSSCNYALLRAATCRWQGEACWLGRHARTSGNKPVG